MTIPRPTLLGDKERDAAVIKRALRQARAWRFRSALLALIAVLFVLRMRMIVPGAVFGVLAFGAFQIARLTVQRTVELQRKLELLEKGR
jgi:hypothetical protein